MALEPVKKTPGLWADPAWKPGDSGTFAVVIGVSRYDHLAGGTGKTAREQYGLPQLPVSALTAYRFFDWLRTGYRIASIKLSRCWLLLSPSEPETALIPQDVIAHNLKPGYETCRVVLKEWFSVLKALSDDQPAAAKKSRSFFFFSGHGVEVEDEHQYLLPSDFLSGDRADEVIGTWNTVNAVKPLLVPEHFFFFDACRTDLENLKTKLPTDGPDILPPWNSRGVSRTCSTFRFQATSWGLQAFQGKPPDISLFGQALMDGLSSRTALIADCDDKVCRVAAHKLACFLHKKVNELAQRYNCTQIAWFVPSTYNVTLPVCELTRPQVVPAPHDPCAIDNAADELSYVIESFPRPDSRPPRRTMF